MTIQKAKSASASFPIGNLSEPAASSSAQVVYREFSTARPITLPNAVPLSSLVNEFEDEPEMAAHLAQARKEISASTYADEPDTLSALRLSVGLSQSQLAKRLSTSQSYIARVESGRLDPSTAMVDRIAEALNVDVVSAFRAIRKQIETRGQDT